jgi:hypothetical protein
LNAPQFAPLVAAGDSDAAVAALAIFVLFGGPILGWVFVSWLRHRERVLAQMERLEMIRHGLVPPGANYGAAGFGPAPGSGNLPDPPVMPEAARAQLFKGIKTAAIGLALFIGLSFIDLRHPGPWLLGGLVPLFVGLAQILTAYLSGATLGTAAWRPAGTLPPRGPEPPHAPQPPPAAPSSGPYSYRPSGSSQELRPPSPPPETR